MASELESVLNIKIVVFIIASGSLLSGEAVPTGQTSCILLGFECLCVAYAQWNK